MSRVCIVRHREYGELALRREAESLRDAGHEVHVICLRQTGSARTDEIDGVRLHALPLSRVRGSKLRYVVDYLAFFLATIALMAVLQRRYRFGVVQVNTMPDFLVLCSWPAKLMGAKVIAFMKEPTPELGEMKLGPGPWPRVLVWIEQAVLRYADLSITVTEDLKQAYVRRGADADRIRVVLNGPGAAQFPGAATDPGVVPGREPGGDGSFTLLCHGAVEDRYGHDVVLRAVARARTELPGLRFRVTGEGPRLEGLRELTRQLDLEDHVELLGWVSLEDLSEELRSADVGVVAQRSSPYSNLVHTNKMYEYILFGKPVIATRLDSISSYFPPDSIRYVEPDDVESMAEAIIELARRPERREELVRNARALYEEYRWERQAELLIAAHDELVAS
jgi:glycosyltransferase involved in cell wall biosynthesis